MKDNIVTTEKGAYLTVAGKCLSESGSYLAISNITEGMMSLEVKNTTIQAAIGTEDKVVEEKKISLPDD